MSRIDEALARLRNGTSIEPPPALPAEGDEPQFALEANAPSDPSIGHAETLSEPASATVPKPGPLASGGGDGGPAPAVEPALPAVRHFEKLALSSVNATATEQYRRLAARLYLAQAEHGTRVVMVTSAMPGEGKTLTATNLALTLAESYKRQVLLIDADLRRPSIHDLLQVPNVSGLNDGLQSDAKRAIPLLRLTDHLTVLTAGRPDRDPMSVLSSGRMKRVLEEVRSNFEWVIIDTPPVALLSDAHLLAALVDTALLIVHAGVTRVAAINTAVTCLGRERIFGVVLNRADEAREHDAYQQYYYAQASKADSDLAVDRC